MTTQIDSLIKDKNAISVQVASSFQTYDISSSPKTSPLAYSSSVITLTKPTNAVSVDFLPTTDLLVSDVSNMATYDLFQGNLKETIECSRMDYIYIKRSTADGTLYFKFNLV